MKKTLAVLVLAIALVVALGAAPAFAKYAGFSADNQYLDWSIASSMASQNADSASQGTSPHGGYATTTIKCAVCHSVHRGKSALLTEDKSCTYCHTPAYYGGVATAGSTASISWYTGLVTTNDGPHSGCTASYCHDGVHGVGASTYAGPQSKLLTAKADTKLLDDTTRNGYAAGTLATWSTTTRVFATGAVCSRWGCHVDSAFGIVKAGTQLPVDIDTNSGDPIGIMEGATGHRAYINGIDTSWNNEAEISKVAKTGIGQIAWKGVTYCNSCHDLTDDNNANKNAFPHANNAVISALQGKVAGVRDAVWLTAAADANTQTTAVSSYNDYTGGATVNTAEVGL